MAQETAIEPHDPLQPAFFRVGGCRSAASTMAGGSPAEFPKKR
jgi:hypothetical protein